jgi:hypothetical protein
MILVDTSIWIGHFRTGDERLQSLLHDGSVLTHPFVIGELALGRLPERHSLLADLHALPRAIVAGDAEVLAFIEFNRLAGLGVGYVDAHLLASARLTAEASIWTGDKRLAMVADRLGLAAARA